jgi:RHS repeat-associated protein
VSKRYSDYLRQRFYDAGVGRFTRRDTYEGNLFTPLTLNKYIYANANPSLFVNPTGLASTIEQASANQIREIISSFYSKFAQQAISIAESGGNPQVITTQLAWYVGLQSVPLVYNKIRSIARSGFATNGVRVRAYREALGLKPFGRSGSRNCAFADIKVVGDQKLTLLARSVRGRKTASIGMPEPPYIFTPKFATGYLRDADTEFKILESFASRYERQDNIVGKIYLYIIGKIYLWREILAHLAQV